MNIESQYTPALPAGGAPWKTGTESQLSLAVALIATGASHRPLMNCCSAETVNGRGYVPCQVVPP